MLDHLVKDKLILIEDVTTLLFKYLFKGCLEILPLNIVFCSHINSLM